MPRTVKNANLQSRSARTRLRLRRPHWMSLRPGDLHLGYVRADKNRPGIWTVRRYVKGAGVGPRRGVTPYRVKRLPGVADDYENANGTTVLSFAQAQDLALAPPPTAPPAGPLTVAGACEYYVAYLRDSGRDERTYAEAEGRLNLHVVPHLGSARVSDLTPEQLRGWLTDLAGRLARRDGDDAVRRSRATANRVRTTFFAALNHAYAEGRVPSDGAWRRRVTPFRQVDLPKSRYLSIDEARRLINAAQGRFRDLVRAALETGARYGELTRLRMHDFNPDSGTVRVAQSKSGKSRDIHLTEEGEAFFRQLTAGRPGGALMLPRPDGGAWQRSDQQHPMDEAVERAKIDPPISFHGLRHTYASHSIMGGVPLQVVAANLGHRDTRMVELHYGHLAASFKRDAIRAGAPKFGVGEATTVRPLRRK
jgi:integrase